MEIPDEIWQNILSFTSTPISHTYVSSQLYRLCRDIASTYKYLSDIHARDIPRVLRWRAITIGDKHQLLSNVVADGDLRTISSLYRMRMIDKSDLITLISTYLEMGNGLMAHRIHIILVLQGRIVRKRRRCIIT